MANVCDSYGAKYQVNYRQGVPSVQNDSNLTQILQSAAEEAWGGEKVQVLPEPSLGAEDFSVYLEHAPGTMFRLGVGLKEKEINHPLHHPQFEVDESAIVTGVVTMAYSAYKFWQQNSGE